MNEDFMKEASFRCKINATNSNNSPQHSSMYTYNPLQAKRAEEIRKVMKKNPDGGKINKNFVKETSSKDKINTESNDRHNSPQDSLMYTYNPLRAKRFVMK